MGRKSEIGYYKSKRGFFTTYKGSRYRLKTCDEDDSPTGPNYLAAIEEFKRIKANVAPVKFGDTTVAALIRRWTEHLEHGSVRTAAVSRSVLKGFADTFGALDVSQITVRHALDWIASQKTWGSGTCVSVLRKLKSCFNWNVKDCRIAVNPLAKMYTPKEWKETPRGAEFVMEPALSEVILKTARGAFKEFLTGLAATGARPAELANATRRNYFPDSHAIIHRGHPARGEYVHKNARKTGKDRVIILNAQVEEIVARNAKHGMLLFPTARGLLYRTTSIAQRWHQVIDRKPVVEYLASNNRNARTVIPYGFRHTFITDRIKKGLSIKLLADLCGTSVDMIERHYSHALADVESLYQTFLKYQ